MQCIHYSTSIVFCLDDYVCYDKHMLHRLKTRHWIGIAIVAIIVSLLVAALVVILKHENASSPNVNVDSSSQAKDLPLGRNPPPDETSPPVDEVPTPVAGVYRTYEERHITDTAYASTILFFHAPWCVECRGFEKAITSESLPSGVQILKVDYDSNQALRQKYGVTIQSSFVRVDSSGSVVKRWNGYGKEKSVTVILDNTK